ncbi:MAG TPA: TatD family hydrolase [Candidatus Solibacter sp.]|nr:TatD family hydrolase [Candidatus Solibacter sp.]
MSWPGLVDTHCHLELIEEAGQGEASAAVEAAASAGITRLITIGLGPDNARVVERARAYPEVFATIGWHPHRDRPPSDAEMEEMAALARDQKVCAVGEIGLDYYWRPGYHEVPVEVQKESFRRMLSLARDTGLPAVIHNREAHADTLAVLREFPTVAVVMHAFSGDATFAADCLELGVTISVAGPVTYPSAEPLREALSTVPLERLVVETDAPFLPPQPWRGKPSRPAMVAETARRLAEVKGVTIEALAEATSATVAQVYRMPPLPPSPAIG